MSNEHQETDTYYAIEWRDKKTPPEGWRLSKDRYENTTRRDTPEEARAIIRKKEAILSSFGYRGTKEFRIVKITVTKEVVK